jgi:hypothetical protein
MTYDESAAYGISSEAMESLRLPAALDEGASRTALDIDTFLEQDERPIGTLRAKVAAHRELTQSHLVALRGKQTLEVGELFGWPANLYIPKGANARDYWFTPAPDDHRYALEWTSTADMSNRASRQDGTLFSFSQLLNEHARSAQFSESGIGIFYEPSMSLGVIALQPSVDCAGTLRTFLEFFPRLAAGYVEVRAYVLLAAWQQIPGGFDLLGFKQFLVATSGRRDQSFGPDLHGFHSSFEGPSLSAPFVVQRGRRYLLGVVNRVSVTSTLTSNAGEPLPPITSAMLRVWGSMSCNIPQIDVLIKRIDIP